MVRLMRIPNGKKYEGNRKMHRQEWFTAEDVKRAVEDGKDFKTLEGYVDNCMTLEALFELWKMAHLAEEDWHDTCVWEERRESNCKKPKIKRVIEDLILCETSENEIVYPGIEQDSFNEDGYVDRNAYLQSKVKVLFVLKETNILKYRRMKDAPRDRSQVSWYYEYAMNKLNKNGIPVTDDNIRIDNKPKQLEKIARMASWVLYKEKAPDIEVQRKALKQISFINLNKRGGDNIEKVIKNYTDKYKEFIKRQIYILAPEYIVCLGTYKLVEELDLDVNLINMWHTAYPMPKVKDSVSELITVDKNIAKYMYRFINNAI